MAMSKRSGGEKQEDIWIAHTELAVAPGHPFYTRLNDLLEGARFDEFVEGLCARFYHARLGRPSLRPGIYFRALLVGYFEGIDGERGIAWRVADSLALRRFLLIGLNERTPDHSTTSRTRRRTSESQALSSAKDPTNSPRISRFSVRRTQSRS